MPTRANIEPKNPFRDAFASSPGPDDYDAIAELFLGGPDPASPDDLAEITPDPVSLNESASPVPVDVGPIERSVQHASDRRSTFPGATESEPVLEAIVLGHLPGVAAPWASQYAAALAESLHEPVGMVRIAEGELSVEMVGQTDDSMRTSSIDLAIQRVRSRCQRFVIRSDADDEAALTSTRGVDHVTILTGANEAAVVAAYRTIKLLSAQRPATDAPMRFSVAFMGADADETARAMSRLTRAVAEIDRVELTQAPGVQRIGPVMRTTLTRTPHTGSIREIVSLLLEPIEQPIRSTRENSEIPRLDMVVETSQDPPMTQEPIAAQAPLETTTTTTTQSVMSEPKSVIPSRPLALRLEGLTVLESRCPYHESIELAVDADGRLNLLAQGAMDRLGELIAVECWSHDHARLLAKAEPMLTNADAPAIRHLFTDEPATMSAILHSDIRVHVLARAAADGYVCLPLNHHTRTIR